MHDEEQSRARVQHTIDEWFSHYGYRDNQRDEELAEKLTRILFVRVNLWSKGGTVTCRRSHLVVRRSVEACLK